MTLPSRLKSGKDIQNDRKKRLEGVHCICFFVLWLSLSSNQTASGYSGDKMWIRIFLSYPGQIEEVKGMGIELVSEVEAETLIDALVDDQQLDEPVDRGF